MQTTTASHLRLRTRIGTRGPPLGSSSARAFHGTRWAEQLLSLIGRPGEIAVVASALGVFLPRWPGLLPVAAALRPSRSPRPLSSPTTPTSDSAAGSRPLTRPILALGHPLLAGGAESVFIVDGLAFNLMGSAGVVGAPGGGTLPSVDSLSRPLAEGHCCVGTKVLAPTFDDCDALSDLVCSGLVLKMIEIFETLPAVPPCPTFGSVQGCPRPPPVQMAVPLPLASSEKVGDLVAQGGQVYGVLS